MEKNEILKLMSDVEYLPANLSKEVNVEKYNKFPLSEISNMGLAFEPLTKIFQNLTGTGPVAGGSGLYRVQIPTGGNGALAHFSKEKAFMGTVKNGNKITGQARLTPYTDPTMLFMALALKSVDDKLESILEIQLEIKEKLNKALFFIANRLKAQ